MALQSHIFTLDLPRETTPAQAYRAGLEHILQMKLKHYFADYSRNGSKPHPSMPGMAVFSYSYKVYGGVQLQL